MVESAKLMSSSLTASVNDGEEETSPEGNAKKKTRALLSPRSCTSIGYCVQGREMYQIECTNADKNMPLGEKKIDSHTQKEKELRPSQRLSPRIDHTYSRTRNPGGN